MSKDNKSSKVEGMEGGKVDVRLVCEGEVGACGGAYLPRVNVGERAAEECIDGDAADFTAPREISPRRSTSKSVVDVGGGAVGGIADEGTAVGRFAETW
jgi:hypothetical protein